MISINNAIISVSKKEGLEVVVSVLKKYKVNIYATDGTRKFLEDKGIKVNSITEVTSHSQILGGRVKTLDFKLFAGILADKNNREHIRELEILKVPKIDLVIVNLYDFVGALESQKSSDKLIEEIDIGGVSLLRAASKNYKSCVCIPSPDYYSEFVKHIDTNNGSVSIEFSKNLAIETFKITCNYDYIIHLGLMGLPALPEYLSLYTTSKISLRYGENPHQKAYLLKFLYSTGKSILNRIWAGAKDISYNNILDSNSAFEIVSDFLEPTATVVKHQNPACVMSHSDKGYLCEEIFKLDYESSFGGILGLNFTIGLELAKIIVKSAPLLHCIVAPQITEEAVDYIRKEVKWGKNVHIFAYKEREEKDSVLAPYSNIDIKCIPGGLLLQQRDFYSNEINYEIMSGEPDAKTIEDLLFAFKVAKFAKSNAIVLAKNKRTIGIGSGQTSRIGAVKNAISKAPCLSDGISLASDAFFPFPDSLEYAFKFGIKNFISPKGSVKDAEVIEFARKNGLTLLFTNTRHFRH